MKIAVFDNCAGKFSMGIMEYWRKKGHEVNFEMGTNPALVAEADLTYIDWLDQNFYCLYNGLNGDRSNPPFPKKRVAVRMIDLDYWQGRHKDPGIYNYMDDLIVINKFYYDRTKQESGIPENKLHLIYPGVDLDKFVFRKKDRGYKIAVVSGHMWEAKSNYEAIRIFQEVNRLYPGKPWELHIRGDMIPPEWRSVSYSHLIEISGLKDRIFIEGLQGEMSNFYKDKDYILVVSHKEAFSYAAAEGMAVGLKPVLNNFFGSEWPEKYRFNDLHTAVTMIGEGDWNPEEYRQYIQDYYDFQTMMKNYDDLFGT